MAKLFILFTITPIVELWLLIEIGGVIGGLPTIGLVLGTGAAGAWLARREGIRAFIEFNAAANRGEIPGRAMLDAVCVFAGGALLLTPGVVTDVIGFLLLVPPSRRLIQAGILKWLARRIEEGAVVMAQQVEVTQHPNGPQPRPSDPLVVDQTLNDDESTRD
jgi:UPF0716 protein FxsA